MTTTTSAACLNRARCYHPTFSPEHGVYIVLGVSFLIGAAAAQRWSWATTLAFLCAMAGFQAEHPLVLQIKQRRSWKPRFLLWGGVYSALALGIALSLALVTPALGWLYLAAAIAFGVDAIAVYRRQQRTIANEFLTFAAVCLVVPLTYGATTHSLSNPMVWSLWLLSTLFFASAIFTVKLRKPKTSALTPGAVYHGIATLVVATLGYSGWLPLIAAFAFGVAVAKYALILLGQDWYRTAPIQRVALVETLAALIFLSMTTLAVLPPRLG